MKSAKDNIIQIAMRMFAENGFHKTSTASISQEANISTGLLFYHFSSKEKLLDAIIDYILLKLDQITKNDGKGTLLNQLESIIDNFFNSLKEDRPFWDLYMTLLYQPDTKELILGRLIEHSRKFRHMVYDIMNGMGSEDPGSDSFEFEVFRIGVFASYLSNHNEKFLEKAYKRMKEKYLKN